ncbi:glycerol kinase GlpK [Pedosphaera parvula]|uniref:Glycerol kinase n=1 Tax=Pedosphaera parvula (strain Ellin514) TaxID=320771 RepID=B9XD66_PEDPL|nr:glycerol kinase GlpK [Pedosphaera parvula]EEF62012.1 glycerol kinase [Pedosphaera parvula Ellin514]
MEKFILALDQGTTSSRAIIFDHGGSIKSIAQQEFKQFYPKPGWVEHDANEIWATQAGVVAEALASAGLSGKDIAGIGITNQRETTIVWDKETGEPIHHAIVWQDRRTAEFCDTLKKQGLAELIQRKTGLVLDAYFSGTKLKSILDHVPDARKRALEGKLAFGTVDTWLVWKLTGGTAHVTDVSNASRTLLYNIHTNQWDDELLEIFQIPRSILPEVKSSSEVYAETSPSLFASRVPIAGIAGDQQASLFGQMCLRPGMLKHTYGTGGFMVLNTGDTPISSSNHLLTTIAWKIDGKVTYALEGSIFIAGAVVQWLRDGLGIIKTSAEIESLARTVPDNGDIYMVPAFVGMGAPHWDQFARGTVMGITRGTTAGHFARAALESIAFQTMDVLEAMEADSKIPIKELRVDGGATVNDTLMQFQADILNVPLVRPKTHETTALGAAYLAGLAVGYWKDTSELEKHWQSQKTFHPSMDKEKIADLKKHWRRAVKAGRGWLKD